MTEKMLALTISLMACLCSMSMYLADEMGNDLHFDTSTDIHVDTGIDLRGIMNRMERLEYDVEVQKQLFYEQRANLEELQAVVNHQNARLLYQNRLIKSFTKRVIFLELQLTSLQNATAKPENVLEEFGTKDNPDPVHVKTVNSITKHRVTKERIRPARAARAVSDSPVAFFAEFHGSGQTNIGVNQNIVFPNVITNIGNGYNYRHGIFTAPERGVYIFSTSIMSGWDRYLYFDIVINGQRTAGAIAAGTGGNHNDQGSVTVVSQLALGDEVWVSLRDPVGASLNGDGYSSFTGCLVTPI